MLKVGITGGIGSGKSTVCRVFETLDVPVFYADKAGRYLMENDAAVINSIKAIFGEDIYQNQKPNRRRIAQQVFHDPNLLEQLNSIIHPAVIAYGKVWIAQQTSPYIVKEAALFFETGSDKEMDIMVGVYAPEKQRIFRVMQRDRVSQKKVLERMSFQMDETEKMKRCHYVINNEDGQDITPQVHRLHQIFLHTTRTP